MEEIKAMSLTELADAADAHAVKMNKIIVYHEDNQTIVINVRYPYEIDLDRIKTEAHLLNWVHHLSGKTWMTTDVLHWFIERVAEIKNLNLYGQRQKGKR